MCAASNTSAVVHFDEVPVIDRHILDFYLEQKCVPGGTLRNWDSYGHKIAGVDDYKRNLLADPQTSGGAVLSVQPGHEFYCQAFAGAEGIEL